MKGPVSEGSDDYEWRVRRCSPQSRMDAISMLESEGYTIHDYYENSSAAENEEIVIVARKPV